MFSSLAYGIPSPLPTYYPSMSAYQYVPQGPNNLSDYIATHPYFGLRIYPVSKANNGPSRECQWHVSQTRECQKFVGAFGNLGFRSSVCLFTTTSEMLEKYRMLPPICLPSHGLEATLLVMRSQENSGSILCHASWADLEVHCMPQ